MTTNGASYKELVVWQKSIALAKTVYTLTENFPQKEIYGLPSQMRRAAVSISSNIAEGQARRGFAEFQRFLYISLGSLAELDTQVVLSQELSFMSSQQGETIENQIYEIRRMLHGLLRGLKSKEQASQRPSL